MDWAGNWPVANFEGAELSTPLKETPRVGAGQADQFVSLSCRLQLT